MPSQRKSRSLQDQGVPIPDKLNGPKASNRFSDRPANRPERVRRQVVTQRSRDPETGLAQETHTTYEDPREFAPPRGGGSPRRASLASPASGGGIGLLAAEFFLAIGLLILLFFAKSSDSLPDRIMNTIKRGTLICAAFFILALISGVGPNANKIAKAFGALLVVAILLTTPIYGTDSSGNPSGVLVDVDNIIKNDWAPSATHDNSSTGTSTNSGTSSTSTPGSSLSKLAQDLVNALKQGASLQGQKPVQGNPVSNQGISTTVGNAAVQLLNGIIPGSGTAIGKLFGF